jgi:hypothetical protein
VASIREDGPSVRNRFDIRQITAETIAMLGNP